MEVYWDIEIIFLLDILLVWSPVLKLLFNLNLSSKNILSNLLILPTYLNLILSYSKSKEAISKLISKPRDDNFKENLNIAE